MSATVSSLALGPPLAVGHLVAADAAFFGVFGVFVVAFALLTFLTVRWALRRDRARRPEWLQRQQQRGRVAGGPPPAGGGPAPGGPSSRANGHGPRRPDQRGPRRKQPG